MKQALAAIISNDEVMPGVHLIWLESPQIATEAQPGQFVMVRCGEDTLLRRPLSIHQVDDNKLAFLFTLVGKGTHWLSQCQNGDSVDLLGPLGNSFSIYPASRNLLLVAGGIGIAPLRFLLDKAFEHRKHVTLLRGAMSTSQLYKHELVAELVLPMPISIINVTEDGSSGYAGVVTSFIKSYNDWADQIFACGPPPMYKTMAQMPELINKPVQISLEVRMGCGLGVCYGCTVKTKGGLKQVCTDGPIFDLDDILWDELNCW